MRVGVIIIILKCNENSGIIHQKRIYGAPDLIIEVLSPGTGKYDLGKKLEVYEKSGVLDEVK
ncbi:Uma2 family endonuclease [Parafilimonas sp.]|uniref:Uma2 family endonuclease n=1 Tax=Parafilimonas sp. TaxID=1969739 RepID=UPI0039E23877